MKNPGTTLPRWVSRVSAAVILAAGCASAPAGDFDDAAMTSPDAATDSALDATMLMTGDGPTRPGVGDGSLASDAVPEAETGACVAADAGPPPYPQKCVALTDDECAGPTDLELTALGVVPALLNKTTGNGFDDDCDGLVDEGCPCPGNGQTKDCYEVPATQVDPATMAPVGWCTTGSLGSLDCAGTEFPSWSGVCRGASPPYAHDVCAPGDFNCDGEEENSDVVSCACMTGVVACPTGIVTEAPYPSPTAIPLIDGSQWIHPSARASAQGWTWTVIGGDCDNVLPNPTFAIYDAADSTTATRVGVRTPVRYDGAAVPARYAAAAGQPLVSIQATAYGNGVAGGQIYPAFGLSGNYVVQGEWDLGGAHYVCTQKVEVRAPGIRAELCWDTVGGEEVTSPAGNDLDLHLARLQGVTCPTKGWDTTCPEGETYEDCYWNEPSGCRDDSLVAPGWGYAPSAASACIGWSSKRHAVDGAEYLQGCTNPRLDKDNFECDKTVTDPTSYGTPGFNEFCGPENINLDDPNDGDAFAIAVNHYGNHGGTPGARAHVNVYCNGERVLSAGYDPLTGQTKTPLLETPGADTTGDYWEVGTVTVHAGDAGAITCEVATVPSSHADQIRDGVTTPATAGNELCVDSTMSAASPPYDYTSHAFVEREPLQGGAEGGIPGAAAGFCKH